MRIERNIILLLLSLLSIFCKQSFAEDKKKGDINAYLKRTGQKFISDVEKREGIYKLKSGMLIEILTQTTNEDARSPTKFDTCEVTYKGTLKDGTMFDSGKTNLSIFITM